MPQLLAAFDALAASHGDEDGLELSVLGEVRGKAMGGLALGVYEDCFSLAFFWRFSATGVGRSEFRGLRRAVCVY